MRSLCTTYLTLPHVLVPHLASLHHGRDYLLRYICTAVLVAACHHAACDLR
jgi:hypothetical protein